MRALTVLKTLLPIVLMKRKNTEVLQLTVQAPVVQKVDNAIHRINHYPLDIAIGFAITYPVDSDLSVGYPLFEQLGPE